VPRAVSVEFFSGNNSALATVTTFGFGFVFTGAAPELLIGKTIPIDKIMDATNNMEIFRILYLLFKLLQVLD
jgi:hypothetical protein